ETELPQPAATEVVLDAIAETESALLSSARKKKASQRTEAEARAYRKYNLQKTTEARARKGVRKQVSNFAYDGAAITKADAKQILVERQIQHPHVIATCVALAETAAKHFKIPFNAHLLRCGLHDTLLFDGLKRVVERSEEHTSELQ